MKRSNLYPYFFCLSVVLCISSCKGNATAIKTYDDLTLMKKEAIHYIPIGTSSVNAKRIMEQSGFKCEFEENVLLSARPLRYGNILYCDKTTWFFLSGKQWKVIFNRRGELVENVVVSVGGVYP